MDELRDIEAIKRLKYKYLRCVDLHRWDELRECFTEDATSAYGDGKYSFEGREKILQFLIRGMDRPTFLTSHTCHQPEIDITSPTTAVGAWALHDVCIDLDAGTTLRGAAFYRDEYAKVGGQWKIKFTGYHRVYEEIEKRADTPSLKLTENGFVHEQK
ncbi:MAG: nuclear transport factor 2 family protein [Candidatus Binatia bacterium]